MTASYSWRGDPVVHVSLPCPDRCMAKYCFKPVVSKGFGYIHGEVNYETLDLPDEDLTKLLLPMVKMMKHTMKEYGADPSRLGDVRFFITFAACGDHALKKEKTDG